MTTAKSRKAKQPTQYPQWAADEIRKSDFADELDLVLGMVEPKYLHDAMFHLGLSVRAHNTMAEVCDEFRKTADSDEKLISGLKATVALLHDHLTRLNEAACDDSVTYDLRKVSYITKTWHDDAMLERMETLELV